MTEDEVTLVAGSAARIRMESTAFADLFHTRLFEVAPETRSMLGADHTGGTSTFIADLLILADETGDVDRFLARAVGMGATYAGRGVTSAHYPLIEEALHRALRITLGAGWTPPMARAWRSFHRLAAETMMRGARAGLFSA